MKTIIVNSAKGGVGKTYITEEIAKLLNKEHSVAILDLDVTTPNISSIEDIKIIKLGSTRIPTKTSIKRYIRKVKELNVDWLVIDTPPTISDTYLAITEVIVDAMWLFVTTPSPNAILDTKRGIDFFTSRGIMASGIVQNMVGTFGDEFDSKEKLGVETVATFRLNKSNTREKQKLLSFIKNNEITETKIREGIQRSFSNYTENFVREEIEKGLPLRFYNLETWDIIRAKLVENDTAFFGGNSQLNSRYDIPTSVLEPIVQLPEGEKVDIRIIDNVNVGRDVLIGSILPARITYDNKVSKGLPMFVLDDGTHIWLQEAILETEKGIQEVLDNGGREMGDGEIKPNIFEVLYLNRVAGKFNSFDLKKSEMKIITEYKDEVSFKEALYSVAILEDQVDSQVDFDNFTKEWYVDFVNKSIEKGVEYAIEGGMLKHIEDIESLFLKS